MVASANTKEVEGQNGRDIEIAATVILGIFLAIIVSAVLESYFGALFADRTLKQLLHSWPPDIVSLIRLAQLIMFLILLARFYGGAHRINQEHAQDSQYKSTFDIILNLVGIFFLFSALYIAGASIWTIDKFYFIIFTIHVFDSIWFILFIIKFRESRLRNPAKIFLFWNALTLFGFTILAYTFWQKFIDLTNYTAQIYALILLLAISVLDWIILWNFYFNPDKWRSSVDCKKVHKTES